MTPAILGEVPFGSLRVVHVAAVTTELEARCVHFPWLLPTKTGIRNLVALLKFVALTKEEQKLVRGSVRSCFVKIELVAIYGVNIFCFVLSVILIK